MISSKQRFFSILTIMLITVLNISDSYAQNPAALEFDNDDPPETTIRLAPYLTFGGQLEFEYDLERNFDLDGEDDEDIYTVEPGLG
ncbi:MAG: hypothetical protein ACRENO_05805, partial [Thermodesulfobacteriota bacterium]